MYLYFNNARKLQTMIAHGSPIRQGDSFNLYVCFDLDFFTEEDNRAYLNAPLYFYYKKPKASSFESNAIDSTEHSVKLFRKNSYDEVTYKLVDGKKYIMYSYQIPSSSEITQQCGELELVFSFYQLVDINNDDLIQDEISNAADFSAKLYVEPTYGKNRPKGDESLTYQTNYQDVLTKISNLESEKNVALINMIFEVEDENSTDDYATLEDRANYIFDSYSTEKKGWLLVGEKTKIEDNEGTPTQTIESTELYLILDDSNMLIIDGEGDTYNWNGTNLTQLNYTKQELDSLLGNLRTFLNAILPSKNKPAYANLTVALEDYLNRISAIETSAIYDVKYESDTIKKKVGKNGEYQKVADKTDLGITNIENNAVYDVKYDTNDNTIKFRKGNNPSGAYDPVASKTDLGITNIENNAIYSVEYSDGDFKVQKGLNGAKQVIAETSQIVQNNSDYLATTKAVFDALEEGAKASNEKNPNLEKFNEAMQKVQYMYNYFFEIGDTDDIDNKINKMQEIIAVLDNLPEDYNIWDTIENIYNKLGEDKDDSFFYNESWTNEDKARFSVKGRIQELEHNADSHIMVFMRYADNQQLFTIPTTAWTTLAEPYTNYPDATCYATIQNDEFKDILDMEIIFDKAVEKELLAGIEVDTTTGVITFYALETPETAITIDTIKIISNLYHTNSLSLDTIAQVQDNKDDLILANQEIATLARTTNDLNTNKQDKSNLVNEWSVTLSQTKYPSEKLVKDSLDTKVNETNNFGNDGKITIKPYNTSGNTLLSIVTEKDAWNYSSLSVGKEYILMNATKKIDDNTNQSHFSFSPINTYFETPSLERHISSEIYKIPYINDFNTVVNVRSETYSREKIDALLNQKQNNNNLVATFQVTPDDTHYPSEKLVKDSLDAKGSLVTAFQTTPDDTHYPSEKLVKDSLDTKQDANKLVTTFLGNVSDHTTYPSAKLVDDTFTETNRKISAAKKHNEYTLQENETPYNVQTIYGGVTMGDIIFGVISNGSTKGSFMFVYVDDNTTGECKIGSSTYTISLTRSYGGLNISVSGTNTYFVTIGKIDNN